MPKNPYDVPPPWDPGYALPANVRAEGLRRRALVTDWAPRGTFTPGAPATASWAVPGYAKTEPEDESLTRTTAWAQRGMVYAVGGKKMTQAGGESVGAATKGSLMGTRSYGMGALEPCGEAKGYMPDPFQVYGVAASKFLLSRVAVLPPARRAQALRTVLDHVDRSLWERASRNAQQIRATGASPSQALQQGLAAAMSDGMIKEVIELGRTRRAPKQRSLLGLGCYGCSAQMLGDTVRGGTEVETQRGGSVDEVVAIGPFQFPIGGSKTRATYRVHTPNLPAEWRAWFGKETARMSALAMGWMKAASALLGQPRTVPASSLGLDKYFGISPDTPVIAKFFDGSAPIAKLVDPKTGEDMGLFVIASPDLFELWYRPMPKPEREKRPWWKKAWDSVRKVVGKIMGGIAKAGRTAAEYAKKGLDALAELGCKVVNSGAAPAAAAGAAAATGVPPQVGAQGVGIAQGLCAEPPPKIEPGPTSATSGFLPFAIVGGGIAALLLLK